jgi:hypothetical protein
MHLNNENKFLLSEMLLQFSDRFHVDECECSFDPDQSKFQAVFISERFAKCLVTKTLPAGTDLISEDDLKLMAKFANDELERQLNELGAMAVFNESTKTVAAAIPAEFTLEIIYEDDATDPSAPGIDWQAIA